MIILKNKIKAIWKTKHFDIPVLITGIYRYIDGSFFFSIENSGTCIPYIEVVFEEGKDPIKNNKKYFGLE